MAKAEDRQLAECKEVRDYADSRGEVRQSGVFDLDGHEFEIPFSRYFQGVKGKFYYPVVFIAERALVSKRTGNPYINRYPSVAWHEVK